MPGRLLIDASLPRAAGRVAAKAGWEVVDVRDIGLGSATDERIAAWAQQEKLVLLTRDFDFADIRNYPPEKYLGLVVIAAPVDATAQHVAAMVERFLRQEKLAESLGGRLAIVEPDRVRMRPSL
jgi:predicted nuclease of predicted toxin-antitoxin system